MTKIDFSSITGKFVNSFRFASWYLGESFTDDEQYLIETLYDQDAWWRDGEPIEDYEYEGLISNNVIQITGIDETTIYFNEDYSAEYSELDEEFINMLRDNVEDASFDR